MQAKKKKRGVAAAGGDRGIDTEYEESAQADAHYATQLLPKDALHLARCAPRAETFLCTLCRAMALTNFTSLSF